MMNGANSSESVEMEEIGQQEQQAVPQYGFHQDPDSGEVRIFIRGGDGEFEDGRVNILGDPKGILASGGRLRFGPFVEKLISQYLLDTLKIYLRLIKNLVQFRKKGVANTVKTAFVLPLTVGFSVLGGLLPTVIAPHVGSSLESAIHSILSFLPSEFSYGIGVFISISLVTNWGSKISDKLMSYLINHILNTPDPLLHFTDAEIANALQQEGQEVTADLIKNFKDAIAFLQGMAIKEQNQYRDFADTRRGQQVALVGEKLRAGNYRAYVRYVDGVARKNMYSLSSATRNTDGNRDQKREAELFLAEREKQRWGNRV